MISRARPNLYNPSFLDDDAVVAAFAARGPELAGVLEALVESADAPINQHLLVVGGAGSGKSLLVHRARVAIRRDPELAEIWFPVAFPESSHEVGSLGELWLAALGHVAEASGEARWEASRRELLEERDEGRLRARALARLMDFADERGARLVLLVEGLHLLLDGGQLTDEDGWALRGTLLQEPRLLLVGTSPHRLDALEDAQRPLYDLFRTVELPPLPEDEVGRIWATVSGVAMPAELAPVVTSIVGGNARAATLLAWLATSPFRPGAGPLLTDMVDRLTEWFRRDVFALPAQERRVLLSLAELWTSASARQVASEARVSVNVASAQLARLERRGLVQVVRVDGRAKSYEVADRMLPLLHVARRRGLADPRVRALVEALDRAGAPVPFVPG